MNTLALSRNTIPSISQNINIISWYQSFLYTSRRRTLRMTESRRIFIRPATTNDCSAISRLCLLTANNGSSAASRMQHHDLPGLTLLLPYLYLPSGFSYVLVEMTRSKSLTISKIVGCVAGTSNPPQFARELGTSWWPSLRQRFPRNLAGTPLDRFFVDLIHKAPDLDLTPSPPTPLRVHALPAYRDHGCDRLLLDVAMRYLRRHRKGARSVAIQYREPILALPEALREDNLH